LARKILSKIIDVKLIIAVRMAQLMGHSTWYQVETDIRILKLYCLICNNHFVSMVDEHNLCGICRKEVELYCDLTPEQIQQVMVDVDNYCHYFGEKDEVYDMDAERDAHERLESRLREYDWWFGDRTQCQFIWYNLVDIPPLSEGHYACARRYFVSAYVEAYHRDDYD